MLARVKRLTKRVVNQVIGRGNEIISPVSVNIDSADADYVNGWAVKPNNPTHRCMVQLFENGELVTQAPANFLREDVLAAGIGDGMYGFSIPVNMGPFDVRPRVFEVRVDGKTTSLQPVVIMPRVDQSSAALANELEQRMEALLALHSERMLREVEQIVRAKK